MDQPALPLRRGEEEGGGNSVKTNVKEKVRNAFVIMGCFNRPFFKFIYHWADPVVHLLLLQWPVWVSLEGIDLTILVNLHLLKWPMWVFFEGIDLTILVNFLLLKWSVPFEETDLTILVLRLQQKRKRSRAPASTDRGRATTSGPEQPDVPRRAGQVRARRLEEGIQRQEERPEKRCSTGGQKTFKITISMKLS